MHKTKKAEQKLETSVPAEFSAEPLGLSGQISALGPLLPRS